MAFLRKARGGATVLGYTWVNDGDVVEVTDEHAKTLLGIPDGDFFVADPVLPSTFSEVDYDQPTTGKTAPRKRR